MRPRAPTLATGILALALLTPLLAGCLSVTDEVAPATTDAGPLSRAHIEAMLTKPVFDVILYEEHRFEASDGTTLALNLFRPEGAAAGEVPVILVMTPYRTHQDLLDSPYNSRLTDYFAPRGYAVAFLDVRGTGNSGGCLEQTGMRQAEDGYEAVEFLAAQPWSNGKVGMFGASYDAETQQSTATLAPPHLTTIVPVASITSQYLWFYKGGIPYEQSWAGMTSYAAIGLKPQTDPGTLTEYPGKVACHVENHQAAMDPEGRFTDYWVERNWKPRVHNITASVLYVHGLQDWNVKPDAIPGWYNDIPSPKKALLGQWGHAYPTREDWTFTLHRWFDHWLKGIDTGIMDEPPVQVEDSLGRWRTEAAWPPLDAEAHTLYLRHEALSYDAFLSPQPPASDEPADAYRDAPDVPFLGGGLDYVSHPLTEDLHVAGVPNVTLYASSSAEETHFVFHLLDISPDGEARMINRGYLNARYWHGDLTTPKDLEPGKVYKLTLDSFPMDHVFREGHRIGLLVMSDDGYAERDQTTATNRIHHTPEHPSSVTLPVIHRNASAFDAGVHPSMAPGGVGVPVDLAAWGVDV